MKKNAVDLAQFLESGLSGHAPGWSRSGRLIAAYLRDNWRNVPFETGASIAAATGLSEMTVIRFIRQLGFSNLREFKDALKTPESPVADDMDDAFKRFHVQTLADDTLAESLKLELKAISDAYQLTTLPRWKACAELIAHSEFVSVIGFQASKGLALDFATRLQYVRGQVRFIHDHSGAFPEIFDLAGRSHCLVQVDTYAYARKGVLLAEKAKELGIPMVIVTDKFTNWAYSYTELVLQGATFVDQFWDSPASLSVILNLLIGSVAKTLGPSVFQHGATMRAIGDQFDEFSTAAHARATRRD